MVADACVAAPAVSPHPGGSSPRGNGASPHRRPAEIQHNQLKPFGRLRCSLQGRKIQKFEDSVRGNALQAVVTDPTANFPDEGSPLILWFYGLAHDAKALDEGWVCHRYSKIKRAGRTMLSY
jgi:hypothetical protein